MAGAARDYLVCFYNEIDLINKEVYKMYLNNYVFAQFKG